MIIGITGGSGTGKTVVSSHFENFGFLVIDSDEVAHKVMDKESPCLNEVAEIFGYKYLNEDKTLNRKKLGEKVFNDKTELENLNKITHKYITKEIEFLSKSSTFVVIDAPLLIESGLDKICDKTVFVSCPKDIRVQRIMLRDGISKEYALARINAQKEDDFYRKNCDFEIINDGKNDISLKIEEILDCLKDLKN